MNQQTLFPETGESFKKGTALAISKFQKKILSKEQSLFNKYSKRIEALRDQIVSEQLKYDKLAGYFLTEVEPEQKNYGNAVIEFVKQLYSMYKYEKLTNIAKEKVSQLIVSNLKRAFKFLIPTEEVKAIYDTFSDTSYDQEEKEQINRMKDSMGDLFKNMFGEGVDLSDMDMMDQESVARKMAEMKELFENLEENNNKKENSRKKTKKEINFEIKKKQAEELQNKNIRSIYTSLAKMLHPDLEQDEMKKLEKEDLMKKVTNAYHEKDLHTLLKLEIEIIHKETENLEHLTDEKLKLLNAALKEQVDELEQEKEAQKNHPKYENIDECMRFSEKRAIQELDNLIKGLASQQNEIVMDIEQLKGKKGVQFLTQILKKINFRNSFDNDFDFTDGFNGNDLMDALDMLENMGKGKKGKCNCPECTKERQKNRY